jgi:ribosomal protein S11
VRFRAPLTFNTIVTITNLTGDTISGLQQVQGSKGEKYSFLLLKQRQKKQL